MKMSIQFQYQPDERRRPIDGSDANKPIFVEGNEYLPIPNVGDTVTYQSYEYDYDENRRLKEESGREIMAARKVKTRHFSYYYDHVNVNIVVTDVPVGEMAMRLKE
jgi:hypothetical protein